MVEIAYDWLRIGRDEGGQASGKIRLTGPVFQDLVGCELSGQN